MSSNQTYPPTKPQRNIVTTIIGVLVVICVLIIVGYFAMLALLGPQIANIFSRVTSGLK